MPDTLKRSAVFVLGLAALFSWSFLFAKHDQALRDVIPFGEDPYDAVGSFGVVVGLLIALASVVRAFRPYREHPPSTAQFVYLVRTQTAVVLAVLITLAADTIAMARHPFLWVGAASRYELVALLGGLAMAAVSVQLLIRVPPNTLPKRGPTSWTRAAITALLATFVLVFYPEQLIKSTATHLLTVVIGAVVLFAPIRPLLNALVPSDVSKLETGLTPEHHPRWSGRHRWGFVLLAGVLIGGFLFSGEMRESGGVPAGRLVFVASVYVGLATAGLLVAYAFLGKLLGLGARP